MQWLEDGHELTHAQLGGSAADVADRPPCCLACCPVLVSSHASGAARPADLPCNSRDAPALLR